MSRSTQGCWTCRVRHKKCDETRPFCRACTSRKVQCHGYGEKPIWLDGGPLERVYRKDIKKAVKENFRLLRKSTSSGFRSRSRPRTGQRLDDDEDLPSLKGPLSSNRGRGGPHRLIPTESQQPHSSEPADEQQGAVPQHTPSSSDNRRVQNVVPLGRNVFEYRDAELLMHYFDYVFPLQFRFYTHDLEKRGRGWLLWLLVKTGPLYQAALSLAALHQYTLRYHDQSEKYVELHNYHSKALRDLQLFLQENHANNDASEATRQMEVLACGVSLISFELFRGGVSDWQLHLNALASIVQNLEPRMLHPGQDVDESLQQSPLPSPRPEREALPFLVAVVLWFDLLSCVSTGSTPRLAYEALLHDYHIKLEDVVGCQNWAMVAIGDLAILDVWKKQALLADDLSDQELLIRSQSVRESLEKGLATLESKFSLSSTAETSQCPASPELNQSVVSKVTTAFASAALVQLYTIVHGAFPGHPDIQMAVQKTMSALEQVQDYQDMRGLIWPICISGCMADESQQSVFEDLIQRIVGESMQDFGNSTTALLIMQKCWALRLYNPNKQWNWQTTMVEMGICGLLV
ncbi:uncharacterized protein A1O9_05406 [Exophiala aquamarina CBS 119918]|uniref:Zn(2)-C6 fungal-type domain-containing protein n=1 Tax=Exophiala aquamarina CBS 119918 TaxID=1182545 RepID=A0A072PBK6_9EURO|nr:uncharacterized protein A1O9_05406 [Exophiala aquamarina CBS 119918]KEF57489.1 hypothetical protein A1O9_05406 [Exophiala aquamarina CBS 119918]